MTTEKIEKEKAICEAAIMMLQLRSRVNDERWRGSIAWWLMFMLAHLWASIRHDPLLQLSFGIVEWTALAVEWLLIFRFQQIRNGLARLYDRRNDLAKELADAT